MDLIHAHAPTEEEAEVTTCNVEQRRDKEPIVEERASRPRRRSQRGLKPISADRSSMNEENRISRTWVSYKVALFKINSWNWTSVKSPENIVAYKAKLVYHAVDRSPIDLGNIVYDNVLKMAKGCDSKFHLHYPSLIMRLIRNQGPSDRRPQPTDLREFGRQRMLKLITLPCVKLRERNSEQRSRFSRMPWLQVSYSSFHYVKYVNLFNRFGMSSRGRKK
ncbi:unnamed protein product [Cochlearia groenlandica]